MKEKMRGKILPFIIGMLIGAIIATSGFLIYEKNKTSETSSDDEQAEVENEEPFDTRRKR